MKLDFCLLACDLNPTYYNFYPLVRKYWRTIVGIPTKLILIGVNIPENLKEYRDEIILFEPIENIHTAFQAQVIRVLYPAMFESNKTIIISDMDIIPLNQNYFCETIKSVSDNNLIIYRNVIEDQLQYPMCYICAQSSTWKEIFKINNEDDIRDIIRSWYTNDYVISGPYSIGWAQDQLQTYKYVNKFHSETKRVIRFTDEVTKFKRLDRLDINNNIINVMNSIRFNVNDEEMKSRPSYKLYEEYKRKIKNKEFSDFHLPRPYSEYKEYLELLLL